MADTSFTEDPYGKVGGTSTFCRTHGREKTLAQYFELDPDVVPTPGTLCPAGHLQDNLIPTHVPCSDCEQHILDTLNSTQNSTVCAIHSQ